MASVTAWCRANSPPLSWVMVRRALVGSPPSSAVMASAARSASLLRRRRAKASRERLSCSVSRMSRWRWKCIRSPPNARTGSEDWLSSAADGSGSGSGSTARGGRCAAFGRASLALREKARQPRPPAGGAAGMAVDGLRTDRVFRSVELHPPRDLLRAMSAGLTRPHCGHGPRSRPWQGGPLHGHAGGWSARDATRVASAPRHDARRCPAGSCQRTGCAEARGRSCFGVAPIPWRYR